MHDYTAGQSFVDPGQGNVHRTVAVGGATELWATYFDVPRCHAELRRPRRRAGSRHQLPGRPRRVTPEGAGACACSSSACGQAILRSSSFW